MSFLIEFAKVLVLLLGAGLIIGGSLAGLCGVIVFDGEIFLLGIVAAVAGATLFVPINRGFRDAAQARAAKRPHDEVQP